MRLCGVPYARLFVVTLSNLGCGRRPLYAQQFIILIVRHDKPRPKFLSQPYIPEGAPAITA